MGNFRSIIKQLEKLWLDYALVRAIISLLVTPVMVLLFFLFALKTC